MSDGMPKYLYDTIIKPFLNTQKFELDQDNSIPLDPTVKNAVLPIQQIYDALALAFSFYFQENKHRPCAFHTYFAADLYSSWALIVTREILLRYQTDNPGVWEHMPNCMATMIDPATDKIFFGFSRVHTKLKKPYPISDIIRIYNNIPLIQELSRPEENVKAETWNIANCAETSCYIQWYYSLAAQHRSLKTAIVPNRWIYPFSRKNGWTFNQHDLQIYPNFILPMYVIPKRLAPYTPNLKVLNEYMLPCGTCENVFLWLQKRTPMLFITKEIDLHKLLAGWNILLKQESARSALSLLGTRMK